MPHFLSSARTKVLMAQRQPGHYIVNRYTRRVVEGPAELTVLNASMRRKTAKLSRGAKNPYAVVKWDGTGVVAASNVSHAVAAAGAPVGLEALKQAISDATGTARQMLIGYKQKLERGDRLTAQERKRMEGIIANVKQSRDSRDFGASAVSAGAASVKVDFDSGVNADADYKKADAFARAVNTSYRGLAKARVSQGVSSTPMVFVDFDDTKLSREDLLVLAKSKSKHAALKASAAEYMQPAKGTIERTAKGWHIIVKGVGNTDVNTAEEASRTLKSMGVSMSPMQLEALAKGKTWPFSHAVQTSLTAKPHMGDRMLLKNKKQVVVVNTSGWPMKLQVVDITPPVTGGRRPFDVSPDEVDRVTGTGAVRTPLDEGTTGEAKSTPRMRGRMLEDGGDDRRGPRRKASLSLGPSSYADLAKRAGAASTSAKLLTAQARRDPGQHGEAALAHSKAARAQMAAAEARDQAGAGGANPHWDAYSEHLQRASAHSREAAKAHTYSADASGNLVTKTIIIQQRRLEELKRFPGIEVVSTGRGEYPLEVSARIRGQQRAVDLAYRRFDEALKETKNMGWKLPSGVEYSVSAAGGPLRYTFPSPGAAAAFVQRVQKISADLNTGSRGTAAVVLNPGLYAADVSDAARALGGTPVAMSSVSAASDAVGFWSSALKAAGWSKPITHPNGNVSWTHDKYGWLEYNPSTNKFISLRDGERKTMSSKQVKKAFTYTVMSNVSAAQLVKFTCADRSTANRLARAALAAKVPGLRTDGDRGVMVPQKSAAALKRVADQEGVEVTQEGAAASVSAAVNTLYYKVPVADSRDFTNDATEDGAGSSLQPPYSGKDGFHLIRIIASPDQMQSVNLAARKYRAQRVNASSGGPAFSNVSAAGPSADWFKMQGIKSDSLARRCAELAAQGVSPQQVLQQAKDRQASGYTSMSNRQAVNAAGTVPVEINGKTFNLPTAQFLAAGRIACSKKYGGKPMLWSMMTSPKSMGDMTFRAQFGCDKPPIVCDVDYSVPTSGAIGPRVTNVGPSSPAPWAGRAVSASIRQLLKDHLPEGVIAASISDVKSGVEKPLAAAQFLVKGTPLEGDRAALSRLAGYLESLTGRDYKASNAPRHDGVGHVSATNPLLLDAVGRPSRN